MFILEGSNIKFYGFPLEDALRSNSNYIDWKDMMELVLEYNGLKEIINHEIHKPTTLDAKDIDEWRKCVENLRRITLEGV